MTIVGRERVTHVDDGAVHPEVLALVEELGLRHEISDGALVVNPPARPPHARVVNRLSFALTSALTEGLEVVTGLGFSYDSANRRAT